MAGDPWASSGYPEAGIGAAHASPLYLDSLPTPVLSAPREAAFFAGRRNPLWSPDLATTRDSGQPTVGLGPGILLTSAG